MSRIVIPAPNLILDRGPCPRKTREIIGVALAKPRISGHWCVQLVSAAGVIKQELEFKNLITDVGLDYLMTPSGTQMYSVFTRVAVGTSSTAPAVTDTALGSELYRQTSGFGYAGGWDNTGQYGYGRYTWDIQFANGNGNLTEVGIFSANSGGSMFCRALFTDAGGTPVTVTKTSNDILRLRYEWRVYPPASSDTTISAYNLSGVSTDIVHRPIGKAASMGWTQYGMNGPYTGFGGTGAKFGPTNTQTLVSYTTAQMGGANSTDTTTAAGAMTPGSGVREYITTVNVGGGNFGGATPGIGGGNIFLYGNQGGNDPGWAINFTPRVLKDNTKRFVLTYEIGLTRI